MQLLRCSQLQLSKATTEKVVQRCDLSTKCLNSLFSARPYHSKLRCLLLLLCDCVLLCKSVSSSGCASSMPPARCGKEGLHRVRPRSNQYCVFVCAASLLRAGGRAGGRGGRERGSARCIRSALNQRASTTTSGHSPRASASETSFSATPTTTRRRRRHSASASMECARQQRQQPATTTAKNNSHAHFPEQARNHFGRTHLRT